MGMRRSRHERGQMTIELAVVLPVLVIVAVIAVNALTFFGQCAVFDRVVRDAVRVHAVASAYGQGAEQACALVEQDARAALDAPNLEISVSCEGTGADFERYTGALEFHPTLFGMGLRAEVFGVSLPKLVHTTSYVVDAYKPGVFV